MHTWSRPKDISATNSGIEAGIRYLAIFFVILLLQPPNMEAQQCPPVPFIHSGEATYYTFASGGGACMFDPTPNDLMVGAMGLVDYANSQVCGECVSLTGPNGTILIRIVDACEGCQPGDIDLSPIAFSQIADLSLGRVPITWKVVPCAVTGPIQYHFKDGSNQWWTAVQIRNSRYPIFSLEYLNQGTYQSVNRLEYNYFVQPSGMGPGPYTFRVTDIYGHVLEDSGIPSLDNASVAGHTQFPQCDTPLPVQLASFTAFVVGQQQVRLDWSTLAEVDNYGFDIQRSDTSLQYHTIPNSFIPGHGTTNVPQRYTWSGVISSGVCYYRLKQTNLDGSVHYTEGIRVSTITGVNEKEIPNSFSLMQNYPNPFNPSTRIRFDIPFSATQSAVTLRVHDVLGREVATLVNEEKPAGRYEVEFDAAGFTSGLYFYTLRAGSFVQTKKFMLLR